MPAAGATTARAAQRALVEAIRAGLAAHADAKEVPRYVRRNRTRLSPLSQREALKHMSSGDL